MTEFDDLNYYEILDVDRQASPEIIRLSYRRLMQRDGCHPDRGGDAATAALINTAYAVLSDVDKRTDYDARLDLLTQIASSGAHVTPQAAPPKRILDPTRECVFCESPHDLGAGAESDANCGSCGSPLRIAESVRLETADQRAVRRIARSLGVTYFTDWRQKRGFSGRTEAGGRLSSKPAVSALRTRA